MKASIIIIFLSFCTLASCTSVIIENNISPASEIELDKYEILVIAGYYPPRFADFAENLLSNELRKKGIRAVSHITSKSPYDSIKAGIFPLDEEIMQLNSDLLLWIGPPTFDKVQIYNPSPLQRDGNLTSINNFIKHKSSPGKAGYYVPNPNYKVDIKLIDIRENRVLWFGQLFSDTKENITSKEFNQLILEQVINRVINLGPKTGN